MNLKKNIFTKTKKMVLIKPEPISMIELDATIHNPEAHNPYMLGPDGTFARGKSSQWYKYWGNHCPTCKAVSNIVLIKESEIKE